MNKLSEQRMSSEHILRELEEFRNISQDLPHSLKTIRGIKMDDDEEERLTNTLIATEEVISDIAFRYEEILRLIDVECDHSITSIESDGYAHNGEIYNEICKNCGKVLNVWKE